MNNNKNTMELSQSETRARVREKVKNNETLSAEEIEFYEDLEPEKNSSNVESSQDKKVYPPEEMLALFHDSFGAESIVSVKDIMSTLEDIHKKIKKAKEQGDSYAARDLRHKADLIVKDKLIQNNLTKDSLSYKKILSLHKKISKDGLFESSFDSNDHGTKHLEKNIRKNTSKMLWDGTETSTHYDYRYDKHAYRKEIREAKEAREKSSVIELSPDAKKKVNKKDAGSNQSAKSVDTQANATAGKGTNATMGASTHTGPSAAAIDPEIINSKKTPHYKTAGGFADRFAEDVDFEEIHSLRGADLDTLSEKELEDMLDAMGDEDPKSNRMRWNVINNALKRKRAKSTGTHTGTRTGASATMGASIHTGPSGTAIDPEIIHPGKSPSFKTAGEFADYTAEDVDFEEIHSLRGADFDAMSSRELKTLLDSLDVKKEFLKHQLVQNALDRKINTTLENNDSILESDVFETLREARIDRSNALIALNAIDAVKNPDAYALQKEKYEQLDQRVQNLSFPLHGKGQDPIYIEKNPQMEMDRNAVKSAEQTIARNEALLMDAEAKRTQAILDAKQDLIDAQALSSKHRGEVAKAQAILDAANRAGDDLAIKKALADLNALRAADPVALAQQKLEKVTLLMNNHVQEAKENLKKSKTEHQNISFQTEKGKLERRIKNHEALLKKPKSLFDRNSIQLDAEKAIEEAKERYRKATRITLGFAIGDRAKRKRKHITRLQEDFYKTLSKEEQALYEKEQHNMILKKEAVTTLERRVSKLKTDLWREQTKDGSFLKKYLKAVPLGWDKFSTWWKKPENKKEFGKRFIVSASTAAGLTALTGGVGAAAILGAAATRFVGSYALGEGAREFYKSRKKDYRQVLADKRSEKWDRLVGMTDAEKKIAIEKSMKLKTADSFNADHTGESAALVTKQNKWTKRWDRIGRLAGGLSMHGLASLWESAPAPSEVLEQTPREPIFQFQNIDQGILDKAQGVEIPEADPSSYSQGSSVENGSGVSSHEPSEPTIREVYDDGSSRDLGDGSIRDAAETAQYHKNLTGDNVLSDHNLRVLKYPNQVEWSNEFGSNMPIETESFLKQQGVTNFDQLSKLTGFEKITGFESNGNSLYNPFTGKGMTWEHLHEKLDLNSLKENSLKIADGQVIGEEMKYTAQETFTTENTTQTPSPEDMSGSGENYSYKTGMSFEDAVAESTEKFAESSFSPDRYSGLAAPENFNSDTLTLLNQSNYMEADLGDLSETKGMSLVKFPNGEWAVQGNAYAPAGDSAKVSVENTKKFLELFGIEGHTPHTMSAGDGSINSFISITQEQATFITQQYQNAVSN